MFAICENQRTYKTADSNNNALSCYLKLYLNSSECVTIFSKCDCHVNVKFFACHVDLKFFAILKRAAHCNMNFIYMSFILSAVYKNADNSFENSTIIVILKVYLISSKCFAGFLFIFIFYY